SHTLDMIKLLDIRCTGPQQKSGTLSGGNQQKICLARALTIVPDILIVAEPTRGIDIGAKKLVLEHLVKINMEQKMTIIVISSELVELRSICDRIAVVSEGKVGQILPPDASDAAFGLAMAGLSLDDAEGGAQYE
ncbi:MAG TPA: ATP-binding cassette domain-containing protein, partial [Clostridia bacterium]|nr:ATP-binding cassette domain-containing protein [Clostridia bacterium]